MTNAREFIPRCFESPFGGWVVQLGPASASICASQGDAIALVAAVRRPLIVLHPHLNDYAAYEETGKPLGIYPTLGTAEIALRRPKYLITPRQDGYHEVWFGDSYVASFFNEADAEFYIAAKEMK